MEQEGVGFEVGNKKQVVFEKNETYDSENSSNYSDDGIQKYTPDGKPIPKRVRKQRTINEDYKNEEAYRNLPPNV